MHGLLIILMGRVNSAFYNLILAIGTIRTAIYFGHLSGAFANAMPQVPFQVRLNLL